MKPAREPASSRPKPCASLKKPHKYNFREKPTVILYTFINHHRWTYQPGSHRRKVTLDISYPPSFCGACLHFSREKDSAVSFPRRPRGRILYTNDLMVLHLLGIFSFSF